MPDHRLADVLARSRLAASGRRRRGTTPKRSVARLRSCRRRTRTSRWSWS